MSDIDKISEIISSLNKITEGKAVRAVLAASVAARLPLGCGGAASGPPWQRRLSAFPEHSSPRRLRRVLPSSILRRVSSTRTSSAAPPQPVLRCAPERAAAPREVRVHTPGEVRPPAGGAGVLQEAPS